jgi:uncharacterized protein (DUF697 family)
MANQTKNELLKSKLAHSLDVAQVETDTSSDATATEGEIDTNSTELIGNAAEILATQSTVPAADRVIMTSSLMAAGAGANPLPGWDIAAVAGVQLKMLADLSKLYDVPFTQNIGKSAIGALVGGLGPTYLARGSLGAAVKVIPGVGQLVGMVALPALSGGCTYALGRVFVAHYESGGTLLSFKPKEFSSRFAAEVKAGMQKIASVKI